MGALHGFGQGGVLFLREGGLGGMQLVLAALVDQALAVEHPDVLALDAQADVEVGAGDAGGTGAHHHDLHVFHLAAGDVGRVDEARAGDDGGAVLVVMEDGDVHDLLELLFDIEALGGLDVFQVDAAEGGLQGLDHVDELVGIGGGQLQVEDVHVGEHLEEHALAFHDGLARQGADVAQAQHGRTVADHGHQVAAGGEAGRGGGIGLDGAAGIGHAGRIGQGQVVLGLAPLGGQHFHLTGAGLRMIFPDIFLGIAHSILCCSAGAVR